MARIHGKKTVVLLGGVDLSPNSNNSQSEITFDSHDTTTYGKNSHVFSAGLMNGTATVSGFYDSTAVTGPRAAIKALIAAQAASGTLPTFIHRPEGTGGGLPQDSVSALITKYSQTHPVADMVTWAVDLQFSDDVNSAAQ